MIGVNQQQTNQAGTTSYPEFRTSVYTNLAAALDAAKLDGAIEFRLINDSVYGDSLLLSGSEMDNKTIHLQTAGGFTVTNFVFDAASLLMGNLKVIMEDANAVPGSVGSNDPTNHINDVASLELEARGGAVGALVASIDLCRNDVSLPSAWCVELILTHVTVGTLDNRGRNAEAPAGDATAGSDASGSSGGDGGAGLSPGEAGQDGGNGSDGGTAGDGTVGPDGLDASGDPANVTLRNGAHVTTMYCYGGGGSSGGAGGAGGHANGGGGGLGGDGYNDEGAGEIPSNGGSGGSGGNGGTAGNGGNGGAGGNASPTLRTITVGVGCTIAALYRHANGGAGGNGGSGGTALGGNGANGGMGHSGGTGGDGNGGNGTDGIAGSAGSTGTTGTGHSTPLVNNGTVTYDNG